MIQLFGPLGTNVRLLCVVCFRRGECDI